MSLAYGLGAAAAAAACGWPAAAAIDQLARRPADAIDHGGDPSAHAPPRAVLDCLLSCLLLAGLAFAVAARVHPAIVAAAGCWLVVSGVPLAVIDVRVRRLPDVLTGTSLAGLAALLTAAAVSNADFSDLGRAGAGGLAVGSLFGLLAVARPGSAGLGDAKLGLSTGAMAGWLGWGPLLASVFAAFVLAAAAGLWLVGTRRARLRGGSLPFGPFLLAGCLIVVLLSG
jgi:leader peptidase (prepilin peptidase)/N-methyltransferase